MRHLVVAAFMIAAGISGPAIAGKLDNSGALSPSTPVVAAATGFEYMAIKLPGTSAVLASGFAVDHRQIAGAIDAAISAGQDDAAKTTALSDTMTRIAISYELRILETSDAANTEVIDRQADYLDALIAGEGVAVCAPVIFDGSRELIGRGLWDRYSPEIDGVMESYFRAVKIALNDPHPVGDVTTEDAQAVVAQMAAQGDQALMDYFGVMTREGEQNCPAVQALIRAARIVDGIAGVRMRAQQARGASRL